MLEKDVQLIRLSEMAPKIHGKRGIEEKSVNIMSEPVKRDDLFVVEEKSIDLISVNSEVLKEDDEDTVSFDEGRLQQWNSDEFSLQVYGALAGIILLFGCASVSAWSITDFLKDMQVNEDDWIDIDYDWAIFGEGKDEFFESRHVIIAMVVLSWNIECIIGGIFGAFIVPILPNRAIYVCIS